MKDLELPKETRDKPTTSHPTDSKNVTTNEEILRIRNHTTPPPQIVTNIKVIREIKGEEGVMKIINKKHIQIKQHQVTPNNNISVAIVKKTKGLLGVKKITIQRINQLHRRRVVMWHLKLQ